MAAGGCSRANLVPAPGNLGQIRHSTLCLINRERAHRRLRKLHMSRSLEVAAQAHAIDMVRRNYFSHLTPAGLTVSDRIRRTAYASSRTRLRAGEDIAWADGTLATPSQVVRGWMASPGHRANILSWSYRHLGVGLALGAPRFAGGGATYTVDFASRG
jgi:uncharacterized protein YkwD